MDNQRKCDHLHRILRQIIMDRATLRFQSGDYRAALAFLKGLLMEFPDDRAAQQMRDEVERKLADEQETAKDTAMRFVRAYYPHELDLFDMAWDIFKDMVPGGTTAESLPHGLGFVNSQADYSLPKVVVIISQVLAQETMGNKRLERIEVIGRQIDASDELIRELSDFLSRLT